ncbi:hypothetical protein BX589_12035 [Paraburkholderia fungorum]|jgi:hypothetical protein|uniref:hypothetical protein n=1 Tax=Paraburkholderia fungorum TaxID=134537 RepID=UPI000D062121|nr:hypothetical protein [Paraburkholderia fungorum]PRZ51194.1 hypothetical protein BX589_12035 [Paraburkholderia fungorum]
MDDSEADNPPLAYWRQISPLERHTLAYAAYHGFEPALRILRHIIDDIKPAMFPPVATLRDEADRRPWERERATYALAWAAIRRNKPGVRSRLRRFLRSI